MNLMTEHTSPPIAHLQLKKILDTLPLWDKDNLGYTTLITPVGELKIKDERILSEDSARHFLCQKYYKIVETQIREMKPPLPKYGRLSFHHKLLSNVESLLNVNNYLSLCEYKGIVYFIKPYESRGKGIMFIFKLSFKRKKKRVFRLGTNVYKTKNDAVNFIVNVLPYAKYFDPQHQLLANDVRKNLEEQKNPLEVVTDALDRLNDHLKTKKYWRKKLRLINFTPIKIYKKKSNTLKELIFVKSFGALSYYKSPRLKFNPDYEIYHESGSLILDRIDTAFEAKVILIRIYEKFNWADPLPMIQSHPKFNEIMEFAKSLKVNPFI